MDQNTVQWPFLIDAAMNLQVPGGGKLLNSLATVIFSRNTLLHEASVAYRRIQHLVLVQTAKSHEVRESNQELESAVAAVYK